MIQFHSTERLTAEQEVVASITGTRLILRFLKQLRNEDNSFALQMAKPSRGSDNYAKWRSHLQYQGEVKRVPSIQLVSPF